MQELKTTLQDEDGNRLDVRVQPVEHGIMICAEGYGDHNSAAPHGVPVIVDFYGGELRVIVWSDINQEDPTHTISLDGAKESKRRDADGWSPEMRDKRIKLVDRLKAEGKSEPEIGFAVAAFDQTATPRRERES